MSYKRSSLETVKKFVFHGDVIISSAFGWQFVWKHSGMFEHFNVFDELVILFEFLKLEASTLIIFWFKQQSYFPWFVCLNKTLLIVKFLFPQFSFLTQLDFNLNDFTCLLVVLSKLPSQNSFPSYIIDIEIKTYSLKLSFKNRTFSIYFPFMLSPSMSQRAIKLFEVSIV